MAEFMGTQPDEEMAQLVAMVKDYVAQGMPVAEAIMMAMKASESGAQGEMPEGAMQDDGEVSE